MQSSSTRKTYLNRQGGHSAASTQDDTSGSVSGIIPYTPPGFVESAYDYTFVEDGDTDESVESASPDPPFSPTSPPSEGSFEYYNNLDDDDE